MERTEGELAAGQGLLYRYLEPDGLPAGEASFHIGQLVPWDDLTARRYAKAERFRP